MTKVERKAEARAAYQALMKFYPLTLENLDGELWKWIPNYEGLYQVSTFGRVKSFKRYQEGKILKPQLFNGGYLYSNFNNNGKQEHFLVHRLVAGTFIPNPKGKREVNHRDGHKLNCYVSNLEWVTSSENQCHAFYIGLQFAPQGEERFGAKLTNEQARYIRENTDGLTAKQLAKKFSVCIKTISDIQMGKKYRNAGGIARKSKSPRVPEDVRNEIRSLHIKGDKAFGAFALSKKFSVGVATVRRIIHGK
ncbi:MAG: NUMOD4 motif-containing HNH endonuclease [Selenomonadaceae bacterium]|nr:NUMOD4 motif-containing HNH endonuclease [Selenomonadaceae bacterium]